MQKRLFPHTITIFNKYREENQEKWQKYHIPYCSWRRVAARTVDINNDVTLSTTVKIRIMENENYKLPEEWRADREGFTFQRGDLVLLGEIDTEITTVQEVRKKYGGILISEISINADRFMMNRHYRIEGI